MSLQINIGYGMTPTRGWKNYDNSWGIRLSAKPVRSMIASSRGLLSNQQKEFIAFSRNIKHQLGGRHDTHPER
jgi:hypothetical protein